LPWLWYGGLTSLTQIAQGFNLSAYGASPLA